MPKQWYRYGAPRIVKRAIPYVGIKGLAFEMG